MQPYEKDYDTRIDITFEVNRNEKVIARQGYSVLDFFADIGGIQQVIFSAILVLNSVWTYNHLDNYMVTKLYKIEKVKKQISRKDGWHLYEKPVSNQCIAMRELARNCVPIKCYRLGKCCEKDLHEQALTAGRARIFRETNIIEIIKNQRFIKMAL